MDSKPETLTTLTASLDSYSNFYQVVIFISIFHEEADVDKPGASSTHTTGLTQSQSLNIVLTSNIHNNDQYPYFSFTVSFILSKNLIPFFFQTSVSLHRPLRQFRNRVLSLTHPTVLWPVQNHVLLDTYWRIRTQTECFLLLPFNMLGPRTENIPELMA